MQAALICFLPPELHLMMPMQTAHVHANRSFLNAQVAAKFSNAQAQQPSQHVAPLGGGTQVGGCQYIYL